LTALGSMPGIRESARGFILECAADGDLHLVHLPPRNDRTSNQKSLISCSTVLNTQGVSAPLKCR
jgi:hypothetical protein